MTAPANTPLVLHLVYRFDTGGLENGVVNLINHMPPGAYRHAVVALTEVVPGFSRRIERSDVEFVALHKPPGHAARLYPRLLQLFRQMRPAIVHTRNLAALECQVPAWWAGVPAAVHGEHGRDVDDLDGSRRRYQWMRRAYRPFVDQYVALSGDLACYLTQRVGVPERRVAQIYNGVDIQRFHPAGGGRAALPGSPFNDPTLFVVGTVGRMQTVKAQTLLASAFARALALQPVLRSRLRLVMVGEGPLRAEAQALLAAAGAAEGISNTILEAMATGLPVLTTQVGGNAELVVESETGVTVPSGDIVAMAQALVALAGDPDRAKAMGQAGRARVERQFSLPAMVSAYQRLYDGLLAETSSRTRRI